MAEDFFLFPVSFGQQQLWFLDQLAPGSPVYNLPGAVLFKGRLDVRALELSLNEIVRRHEILRTNFRVVDGQPVQIVAPPASTLTLPLTDLRDLPQKKREAEARRLSVEEGRRPFNLAHSALLRSRLVRLAEDEHVLLLTSHHIVSDGWALGVFLRELVALYESFTNERPSPLPELSIQYGDFAVWQRESLSGELLKPHLDYWKQQLGGELPLLELPLDHPRPPVQTAHGARQELSLDRSVTAALKALSYQTETTLFTVLLSAFKVLLYRYTGQMDIIIGTPVAGRNQTETENLIGLFTNTLVLRTELSGDSDFIEVLRRVRGVTLAAYEHQDVPFEKLVEELQPERNLSRMPLFQVMFAFQNAPLPALELPDVTLKLLEVDLGTAKFDLTLNLSETSDFLNGYFEYNTDLFEAGTIARLSEHFQTLLQSIVANPHSAIASLPLLTESERQEQLREWNQTTQDYPRQTLPQLFEAQTERTPDATALIFEEKQLSYRELNERANQVAHYLRRLGVGPEVLVGVMMERSVEMVVSLLGILKAGGAYLPLDAEYPRERLQHMIRDSGCRVVISEGHLMDSLEVEGVLVVNVDIERGRLVGESREQPDSNTSAENLAYVIYTSGSTGLPKGTLLAHKGVVNCLWWMQETFHLSSDDRVLLKASLSFDASVWELFWPLVVGACVVVAQPGGQQDGAYLIDTVIKHSITTIHFVPSMLPIFLDRKELSDARSLKQVIVGGEALPVESLKRFFIRSEAELHNFYGPTETSIGSIDWPCVPGLMRPTVPIGRPISNTDVYILNHDLQPVPVGVAGELYIGGAGVARGYLNRPALTAERFIPHPFSSERGARLYRTGDVASYLPDGNIEFLGRADEQVKIRGYRIELGEVQSALGQHPEIHECVVLARENGAGDKSLVAYIVAEEGVALTVSGLRQYLREKLPEQMIPSHFILLTELPLTPSGKLDKRSLAQLEGTRAALAARYVAPETATEEMLCGIWVEVLKIERVGVEDNFFELGGHSLLATQVMGRVREVFGVDVPLRRLFEQPTVAALAHSVEAEMGMGPRLTSHPIKRLPHDEDLPLSFAQQRLWFLHQLEPNNPFYNMTAVVRLSGGLNKAALERTLSEILRRHEALRTNFVVLNQQPRQVIAPAYALELPVMDISELSETQWETEVRRHASDEAVKPFDLSRDPLLRANLLRLADEEHVLLITLHHIIGDGWSVGVLIGEVVALYEAFCTGRDTPLPELPIQYADYAQWQRQWLQGEFLEQQLAYWKQQLADLPQMELPTDRPRPLAQTFRGAVHSITLPAELAEALHALSRREGATLFMTLLAAFKAQLYRYTAQTDIVVGSPIANRHRPEIKDLIGFFVNTLVLRTDLSGNPTFLELLQRVREVALGAYAHQDLPFEKLVEELHPERDLSRQPLFQIAFVLQNAPRAALELPGLSLALLDVHNQTAKFDLGLEMWESPDGLKARFEYNTDLFDAQTIIRMAEHFHLLLTEIVANPEQRIAELRLLTEREQQQLREWNQTAQDHSQETLPQLFEAQTERTPDATALIFEEKQLSYRELNERANQVAHYLRRVGVGPEALVGILMERSIEMVVALLGILKAGGAYVPLDAEYPKERLRYMLRDSKCRVLLTKKNKEERIVGAEARVVDVEDEEIAAESRENVESEVSADNLAYVIYTSGSTGAPNGVLIQHGSAVKLIHNACSIFEVEPRAHVLHVASFNFDAAVLELFLALSSGASLCLTSRDERISAEQLGALVERRQLTTAVLTPSLLRVLDEERCRSLRVVSSGAERLTAELARRWSRGKRRLLNCYGPTEATIFATYKECKAEGEGTARNQDGNARDPGIGHAIESVEAYVLDAGMELVPVGVVGELYIGGAGIARGYLNQPALTSERFLPHPFSVEPGARLYRTGDLARWMKEGELEYVGRVDEQVKVRGHRVELGEVEAALREQEGVRECVVVARADNEGENRLVAFIVADAPQRELSIEMQLEQVAQWETVFSQTYNQSPAEQDPTFNIIGWKSTYTGLPIPDYEMREWVDATVEQILSLHPKRVLEIGCGSGLLLLRLASQCEKYCGTDFSKIALHQLERQVLAQLPEHPSIALLPRGADNFEGLNGFDAVILNSVAQYFPSIGYLMQVIEGAVNAVDDEGFIYIGDVRSLPLLETFYSSVELSRASSSLSIEALRRRVQKRLEEEEELVIDPGFFIALKAQLPRIKRVEVVPKRGHHHNELTRFRYQVIIHVGREKSHAKDIEWIDWRRERPRLDDLRKLLIDREPEMLAFANIANARLSTEVKIAETLAQMDGTGTVDELKELISENGQMGLEPEDVWQLGAELSYSVELNWARHDRDGSYDLILTRRTSTEPDDLVVSNLPVEEVNPKAWSRYANDPLRARYTGVLARQLRARLKEKLPEQMIPSHFILLKELPLTPSGKLDKRSLAQLEGTRPALAVRYQPPETATEEILCGVWAEVLGVERVGIEDNFFELGGHSLLATQVIGRVREVFRVEVALRRLFESPTVRGLSQVIETEIGAQRSLQTPAIRRVKREEHLPLSFAQQRLWFLEQLTPNNIAYNIPAVIRLDGAIDRNALQQSFTEILRRHESLRTSFPVIDAQPIQHISPPQPLNLPLIDLSHLETVEREQNVRRLVAEEARLPFDLTRAPLLRANLLRLSESEHVLLLTMHHIISDGWSMGVLIRELTTLYSTYVRGIEASPLAELSIQYADYAVWQREQLLGAVLDEQLSYWREQLRGAPAVLELPTDRPRPLAQSYRGGQARVSFGAETVSALKELSQSEGVTLFMTLLAAFDVLLWRYSGQEEIVIGSPIANRNRAETEHLIGFFVNTLALRVSLAGNPGFRQLLGRVKEVCLGAYAHQEVPFERLVEEIAPERTLSHTPLFQVMMVLQNAPVEALELPGLKLSRVEVGNRTAKFDLTLLLEEEGDRINGWLEYNADLLDETTVQRMAGHLQTLLKEIAADAGRRISELPLLTQPELERLLIQWNETEADYTHQCAHQLFEAQAKRTPESNALVFGDQQVSYRELNERANRLAHYLRRLGIGPDSLVGIMMERSLEMVVALLGVLKAGGAYVPLDVEYPRERLLYMMKDSGCRVLLTKGREREERAEGIEAAGVRIVDVEEEEERIREESVEDVESKVTAENLAYVIYTSGSTGQPKGVAMQHRPLVNLIEWQHSGLKLSPEAKTLQISSLSFDASFNESFATWRSGGALILISEELRRDADALLRVIAAQKVERLFLPFVTLQQLAEAFVTSNRLPVGLREILSTAEQLHITQAIAEMFKRLPGCTLYNEYGPSESHVVTAFTLSGSPDDWDALPAIGVPIANTQIYLLNRYLQPVPVGVPGELYIGGVNLARGYLNKPAATAERFIPNPFGNVPGARLYKTGDLARYLPDGNIKYLGRMDEQVKLRGFRVELGEIEAVLAEHCEVREAVVAARGTAIGDKRLVAYIVAEHDEAPPNTSELRAHLKRKLPDYMVPSAFVVLSEMPLTPSGKVDRRTLPEPSHLRPEIESEYVAPRSAAEQVLAGIWARVLKLERVGIHDNFFEIGGHSLLATQLISQVRDVFRLELPLRRLFEEPTVEGLLKEIALAWGGMEIVEEIALTMKEIEHLPEETVKALLTQQ